MTKAHWLGLSTLPGIGGATMHQLIDRFGSAEAIYQASDAELLAVPRVTARAVDQLRQIRLSAVEAEMAALEADGISSLTWEDAAYPRRLQSMNSEPVVLYVQGMFRAQDARAVAIVGTRHPAPEAAVLAQSLGRELAQRGLTIVSGLAIGIDTAAHEGALLAENGRTLAVLGCGLKSIHPQQNIRLAQHISDRGALISEYPARTRVGASQLVARNRIISGLSRAVIVVQAHEKSGSLDTVQKAQKQGRVLFAVPGSPGTDRLIRQGMNALNPDRIDYDGLVAKLEAPTPAPPRQMSLF